MLNTCPLGYLSRVFIAVDFQYFNNNTMLTIPLLNTYSFHLPLHIDFSKVVNDLLPLFLPIPNTLLLFLCSIFLIFIDSFPCTALLLLLLLLLCAFYIIKLLICIFVC